MYGSENQYPYLTVIEQANKPAAPPSGKQLVYIKTDHSMYREDSAGTEVAISSGSQYVHPNHTGQVTSVGDGAQTISENAVDDTMVGDRVPQFPRRQGGSDFHWETPGSTNYIPTTVQMQSGARQVVISGAASATASVSFPIPFLCNPCVIVGLERTSAMKICVMAESITALGFHLRAASSDGATITDSPILHWLAIGTEWYYSPE